MRSVDKNRPSDKKKENVNRLKKDSRGNKDRTKNASVDKWKREEGSRWKEIEDKWRRDSVLKGSLCRIGPISSTITTNSTTSQV